MKLKLFLLGVVLAVFICSCTNNDEIYDDSTSGIIGTGTNQHYRLT